MCAVPNRRPDHSPLARGGAIRGLVRYPECDGGLMSGAGVRRGSLVAERAEGSADRSLIIAVAGNARNLRPVQSAAGRRPPPDTQGRAGDTDGLTRDVGVRWFGNGGDAPRNTLSSLEARLAAVPPPALSFILEVIDMWVYINYPNPHFTLHRNESCGMIQMHHKPNQRVRSVSISSLGDFLSEFIDEKMRFGSQSSFNDVWIKMELDTPEQETGLVHVVQALLGRRYTPLSDAPVGTHC